MTIWLGPIAFVTRKVFDKEWHNLYETIYRPFILEGADEPTLEPHDEKGHTLLLASMEILNRRLFGPRKGVKED